MKINLLSDTVTIPTTGMLEAMMNAEVGDDVFQADPTVNKLQDKLAKYFGREAALFFPSGTMVNQVAIKIHTQPGEQLICHEWAHIYNYEGGGPAFNSGVSCNLISGNNGRFTALDVLDRISNREDIYQAITRLVSVENTMNKGGGACWDMDEIKKIHTVCKENDLAFHLDGARLFNALIAKDEDPKQYGDLFDTISICLSKGLGCPVGSLLIGDKKHIKKALRYRKIFGGGMRQVGYLAAAGIYALDHHVERLSKDHENAKTVGRILEASTYIKKVEPIATNIIIFYTNDDIDDAEFIKNLAEKGVLITGMGNGKLRMVFHLDITDKMMDNLIEIIQTINTK